jgi:hypothetical protein
VFFFILLCNPSRQAGATSSVSSDVEQYVFVRVFSAKVWEGVGKSIYELDSIARERGTEEILMFLPSDGPEKQAKRWLVRLGSNDYAYPGFTAKMRNNLMRLNKAGASQMPDEGEKISKTFPEKNMRIELILPHSFQFPLVYEIVRDGAVQMVHTTYEIFFHPRNTNGPR